MTILASCSDYCGAKLCSVLLRILGAAEPAEVQVVMELLAELLADTSVLVPRRVLVATALTATGRLGEGAGGTKHLCESGAADLLVQTLADAIAADISIGEAIRALRGFAETAEQHGLPGRRLVRDAGGVDELDAAADTDSLRRDPPTLGECAALSKYLKLSMVEVRCPRPHFGPLRSRNTR